jgi:hypothetical protein
LRQRCYPFCIKQVGATPHLDQMHAIGLQTGRGYAPHLSELSDKF